MPARQVLFSDPYSTQTYNYSNTMPTSLQAVSGHWSEHQFYCLYRQTVYRKHRPGHSSAHIYNPTRTSRCPMRQSYLSTENYNNSFLTLRTSSWLTWHANKVYYQHCLGSTTNPWNNHTNYSDSSNIPMKQHSGCHSLQARW